MICPKCGFDQPDDAYCAFCGINIKKYRQVRRKKQYVVYVLVSLVIIAGIFIAVNSIHKVKPPELATPHAQEKTEGQVEDTDLPQTTRERFASRREVGSGEDIDHQRRSATKREESWRHERFENGGSSDMEPARRFPLSRSTAGSAPESRETEQLTAKEWFDKGRVLDDESEAEVEFYNKALELNPEFAPAYYRLGAIHFRHARYELADQEFAKFIEHASEADRQAYDIYVYYSPSDMERLSAAAVTEKAPAEEEENKSSIRALREAGAEVEEEEKEGRSESEAVEKAPEETQEGQIEAAAEVEEIEGEEAGETEEPETETGVEAEEIEKEGSEDTEEEETETPAEFAKESEEEAGY